MKNKNRIFRVSALLLVLCFISTVMISGTFAKYTSEYSGQDTALIAKWDLDVTDGSHDFAISPDDPAEAELDLFSHAYNENIIATDGTQNIIAPGVSGDFILSVTNNSDVAAKVEFAFSKTGADVPIQYCLGNFGEEDTIYNSLTALQNALNLLNKFKKVAETNGTATQTVYWRWPYEVGDGAGLVASDEEDTELGQASAGASRTNYVLTITTTATQIAPTTPEG